MDDALLDVILGRIDGDTKLSEGATELLLAACQGDQALADTVGGDPPPRPERRAPDGPTREPVGAFLASITAQGFRGVGPAQTLTLHPGRGLTVVVGRNGSGKSSFAEALEVLLTGTTARFGRHQVFKDGWRNLHQPHPARIAAEAHVEGAPGNTTIERTWADGAGLDDGTTTVQVAGEKVAGLDRLGWSDHITTYRPFLAHSELEAMLDSPSGLYDRLASVLGLDDLTAAQDRLRDRRRTLEAAGKAAEDERKVLLADLAQVGVDTHDERASRADDLLARKPPDLDELARLVTGGEPPPGGPLDVLRHLANLVAPDLAAVNVTAQRLREAASAVEAVTRTEAGRAKELADLLDKALQLHRRHPADTACPVCGQADAIGAPWRDRATGEVARLRTEADAADRAHADAARTIQAATALVRPMPQAVGDGPGAGIDTARLAAAWTAWSATPPTRPDAPGNLRTLADHLETAVDLVDSMDAVRKLAADELASRDDRWSPVAKRIAAWIDQGRAAAGGASTIAELKAAEAWLKAAHDDIRNDRLAPIAARAQETWRALRHESNVDLGAIRLSGDKTRRRVELHATVDGTDGNALGVMSQGEVNALALSVFLPRATLPESPFRFVVIDDPVQAMDPSKVEGLARVLDRAAQTNQVIVFTHDDRLPTAIRHLDLTARIVQVQRRPGSLVEISPASDAIDRALDEARALANGSVPAPVQQRVVPGLCRLALEAALTDISQRRQLRAGRPHSEVDAALAAAQTLHDKATLALFGNLDDGGKVLSRLNQLGRRHADTFQELKKGAHGLLIGNPHDTVTATEQLIEALRKALP